MSEIDKMNSFLQNLDPSFSLDENGSLTLSDESETDIIIDVPEPEDTFYLSCQLLPFPQLDREDFFHFCLSLNLFQTETLGGALAVDPRTDYIVFCFSRAIDETDYSLFENILNNFFDTCRILKSNLIQFQQGSQDNENNHGHKNFQEKNSSQWIKA